MNELHFPGNDKEENSRTMFKIMMLVSQVVVKKRLGPNI